MTRDYTKVPGYEGMTQPQARYNYLHDLLDAYMRLTSEDRNAMRPCKVMEERGGCRYCSFSGFLGGDPEVCCAWRAEAQPDKAIEILEMLVGRTQKVPETEPQKSRMDKVREIVRNYTSEAQLGVAQEECAELIQAISKVRRRGEFPATMNHLAEEIADVEIMCAQLTEIYDLSTDVKLFVDEKLDRQLERIREGDIAYETTGE